MRLQNRKRSARGKVNLGRAKAPLGSRQADNASGLYPKAKAVGFTPLSYKVREERRTVVVEYANGEKLVIKPM